MSDLLLVGEASVKGVGKEYFLHCMDWWYQIVWAIEALVDESFPFYEVFYRDLLMTPMTPHLSGVQASSLAGFLIERRESGELGKTLERILLESLDEDREDVEVVLQECLDERMVQFDDLIEFLEACGGCHAKWYGYND